MDFPAEIWEHIFWFCSASELKEVRSVCRRWNQIVTGCPALRERLAVRFLRQGFRGGYVPMALPPAGSVVFQYCALQEVAPWWMGFGRNLRRLSLVDCRISMPLLFWMLTECPNLREFRLWDVSLRYEGEVDIGDFRLESLEKLDLTDLSTFDEGPDVLDYFRQMFPRLKSFSLQLLEDCWDKEDTDILISLLESVKETLQDLKLALNNYILKKLCEIDQLHLQQAEFGIDNNSPDWDLNLWNRFCKNQSSMLDIDMWGSNVTDQVLCAIVTNMPNLKQLSTELSSSLKPIPTTFMSHLINVEDVIIHIDNQDTAFRTPFSPCLKSLFLDQAYISNGLEFLMNSPHLQELILIYCQIQDECPLPVEPQHPCSNLKHLELNKLECTKTQLDYILNAHPALETVSFTEIKFVHSDTIVQLLLRAPKLYEVGLFDCCHRLEVATAGNDIMRSYHKKHGSLEGSRDVRFLFG